jgi:hypothetical protein
MILRKEVTNSYEKSNKIYQNIQIYLDFNDLTSHVHKEHGAMRKHPKSFELLETPKAS